MKAISITEVMRDVNCVRYLNLLLIAVALLILALFVREYAGKGTDRTFADGGMVAAGIHGKARKSGFYEYAVIGSSGVLGISTVLKPIRARPVERQGQGTLSPAAGSSQLTLLGTVTGAGEGVFAIFKDKTSGEEEVVRRGESVFSMGTLVSVSRFRAVVQSGGRNITFSMDLSDKERGMEGNANPLSRGGRNSFGGGMGAFAGPGRPGNFNPFTTPANSLAKPKGHGSWLVDKRALDSALKDSNKVLSDARFYPYREGGVVKGYLISQVRSTSVFYGMGIRNGDIILRVNDYTIDAPEKAMSLMKGLKGETNVKVDFLRRGKAQTFKYEIR